MEKINVLIVEDDPIIALDLKRALTKLNYQVINAVTSGEDALAIVAQQLPDIILMDIQLDGDLDGVDTAHQISRNYAIPIIFLTSNTDTRTFNRAKLTQPHGFLSKPFRMVDITNSIDLAFLDKQASPEAQAKNEKETLTAQIKDCIFVKSKEHLIKINLADIQYIEADSCYCTIVTQREKYVIVSTLKKFSASIQAPFLMRTHRSFIINLNAIEKIGDGSVFIANKMIPIGRSYRASLLQRIPKY